MLAAAVGRGIGGENRESGGGVQEGGRGGAARLGG